MIEIRRGDLEKAVVTYERPMEGLDWTFGSSIAFDDLTREVNGTRELYRRTLEESVTKSAEREIMLRDVSENECHLYTLQVIIERNIKFGYVFPLLKLAVVGFGYVDAHHFSKYVANAFCWNGYVVRHSEEEIPLPELIEMVEETCYEIADEIARQREAE